MSESRRVAIMQPYFFPYLGYLQLISCVDVFVIYEHVTFRKRSWINRNRLMDAGTGSDFYFGFSVSKGSSNQLIRDVKIVDDDWRSKLKKLIFYNYKRAPFFGEIYPVLCDFLDVNFEINLHLFVSKSIIFLCDFLEIKTKIVFNTPLSWAEKDIQTRAEKNGIEPKTQRILDLSKEFNCNHYVNPIGGTELYDKDVFNRFGLQLSFLKSGHLIYNQFNHEFVPYLSVLDSLMHLGKEGVKEVLDNYELL